MHPPLTLAALATLWCACVGVSTLAPPPPPPRSVVSVRYEGGHVAELRVAQEGAPNGAYAPGEGPSLSDRRRSCTELCRAGMGGEPCGEFCEDLMPTPFREIIINESSKTSDDHKKLNTKPILSIVNLINSSNNKNEPKETGRPRFGVCPVLCQNNLGYPICGCTSTNKSTNWPAVCSAFCKSDSYVLPGCPSCPAVDDDDVFSEDLTVPLQYRSMEDVWVEWCKCQCKKGEGGAACNCDLIPFKFNHVPNFNSKAIQC